MLTILDHCRDLPVRTFDEGEVVVTEGGKDGFIYVLKKGSVEVAKRGFEINRTATPGAVFGEVSVMLDRPHTATVVALEPCEFYFAEDGETLLREHQELFREIARLLALRLVGVSEKVVELHDRLDFKDDEGNFGGVLNDLVDHL